MKGIQILPLAILAMFTSCGRKKTIAEQMDQKATACYRAISGKDTAWLTVDTSHKQLLGFLKINNVAEKKSYNGQLKGYIHGDTLKGHFDFKVNDVDKWYRNPVAFLRSNGNLVMGVGEITMVWGSAYFDEKKPIDYEKGRFIFEAGDCEQR